MLDPSGFGGQDRGQSAGWGRFSLNEQDMGTHRCGEWTRERLVQVSSFIQISTFPNIFESTLFQHCSYLSHDCVDVFLDFIIHRSCRGLWVFIISLPGQLGSLNLILSDKKVTKKAKFLKNQKMNKIHNYDPGNIFYHLLLKEENIFQSNVHNH